MEPDMLKQFMELGSTGAFLFYLYIKNGRQEKFNQKVVDALARNTKVLIKVAQKHALLHDADDLIEE